MACNYCLSSPCRRGCPNYDDPEPIGFCNICEKAIYLGQEDCLWDDDVCLCEECALEEDNE